ncbi:hypothetical protein FUAX_39370 (plasmid) [Fulvitalea axinellae]|uniref:HTH LytTR-type domain-containing protein n=1 Tax=Fulvitalea axinellae TaxID=1182444 RepID=A0AAU9DG42_9BACT|nr:hypothetical protein FUAX_39370 [Fulvitalea axinellae]
MKIKQFLNLPFNFFHTKEEKWLYIFSSSLFFMLFLLTYRPFGDFEELKFKKEFIFVLLYEGAITFIAFYISQFWLKKYILKRRVRSYKANLLYFMLEVALIQLIMLLLMGVQQAVLGTCPLKDGRPPIVFALIGLEIYFSKCLVLIYPLAGSALYIHIRRLSHEKKEIESELHKVQQEYSLQKDQNDMVDIMDENGNVNLTIPLAQLLTLESSNQYVMVRYFQQGQARTKLVRTQLKKVLSELTDCPIIQCHRSFAANLLNVNSLKVLNRKNYLIMNGPENLKIPVSKTYLANIKEVTLKAYA